MLNVGFKAHFNWLLFIVLGVQFETDTEKSRPANTGNVEHFNANVRLKLYCYLPVLQLKIVRE